MKIITYILLLVLFSGCSFYELTHFLFARSVYTEFDNCGSYIDNYNQLNDKFTEISKVYDVIKSEVNLTEEEVVYYETQLSDISYKVQNALFEWQECQNMNNP